MGKSLRLDKELIRETHPSLTLMRAGELQHVEMVFGELGNNEGLYGLVLWFKVVPEGSSKRWLLLNSKGTYPCILDAKRQ